MKWSIFLFVFLSFFEGATQTLTWEFLGPKQREGGYWGMGRVTDIAFHPTDPKIFYVGAPKGGIWKTEDGGESYFSIGDALPYNSVGNVVTQRNPDIIHITLGDRLGWWTYGMGVYVSMDGGQSWFSTSLKSDIEDKIAYIDMKGSPHIDNLILVATTEGLFRTTDGITFSRIDGLPKSSKGGWGNPFEIVFHPTDKNIIYLSWWDPKGEHLDVFRSEDTGKTWLNCTQFNFNKNGKIYLAVTPLAPDRVYAKVVNGEAKSIFYSENKGNSWYSYAENPALDKSLLFASHTIPSTLYTGYQEILRSVNGGKNFASITQSTHKWRNNYVHYDQWVAQYNPLNQTLYWGNDGGIYTYKESTGIWTECSKGLGISEIYRVSIAQNVDDVYLIGTQDNGAAYHSPIKGWINANGGDAVSNAIHPFDENIAYSTFPNGRELYITYDGWRSKTRIEKNAKGYQKADWISPFDLNPKNPQELVLASQDVFYTADGGSVWKQITFNLSKEKIKDICFSRADPKSIYAISKNAIYESSDGGKTWRSHPFSTNKLVRIISHPKYENHIWVINNDIKQDQKVYYSEDRGNSFINISANLPNIYVYCLVYDEHLDQLFVGTEHGVYYSRKDFIHWEKWGKGLPNTVVKDLDIHFKSRKLYAASYGRGLWRIALP